MLIVLDVWAPGCGGEHDHPEQTRLVGWAKQEIRTREKTNTAPEHAEDSGAISESVLVVLTVPPSNHFV